MKFEQDTERKTVTIVMESVDNRHQVRSICDMIVYKFRQWPTSRPKCFIGDEPISVKEILAFLDEEKDTKLQVWPRPFRIVLNLTKKTHRDLFEDIKSDALIRKALDKKKTH